MKALRPFFFSLFLSATSSTTEGHNRRTQQYSYTKTMVRVSDLKTRKDLSEHGGVCLVISQGQAKDGEKLHPRLDVEKQGQKVACPTHDRVRRRGGAEGRG